MLSKIFKILDDIMNELRKDNVGAYAAQCAFFLILSAIPFIILSLYVLQFTIITRDELIEMITLAAPDYIANVIIPIIREMYNKSAGVITVVVIGAVWSSAKGIQCLAYGLNIIFNIAENRNWLILRIRAIGYTLFFVIVMTFALLFVGFGNIFRKEYLSQYIPYVGVFKSLVQFRLLIMFFVIFMLFLFVLKFLPNRRASFRSQMPVAAISSFCWVMLSELISLYVDQYDGFSMYGSMMTVMLTMTWMYFGMYILLIFAELDSMYEEKIRFYIAWKRRQRKAETEEKKIR